MIKPNVKNSCLVYKSSSKPATAHHHADDTLELNFSCHRSASCALNSLLYKTQHVRPKHIQYFNHLQYQGFQNDQIQNNYDVMCSHIYRALKNRGVACSQLSLPHNTKLTKKDKQEAKVIWQRLHCIHHTHCTCWNL